MKHTLAAHDRALAQIISSQNAAALALQNRQTTAARVVSTFITSPSESTLAAAIAAQSEIASLSALQDALPDPARREQALRDDYARRNRDDLAALLQSEFDSRTKNRSAWRKSRAEKVAQLAGIIALGELPHAELVATDNAQAVVERELAHAADMEREAARCLSAFKTNPTHQTFTDARATIANLSF